MSVWDWVQGTIQKIGVTPAITQAVAVATANPSLENIRRVEEEYRAIGSSPPAELMSFLYDRYYATFPSTVYGIPGQVYRAAMDWTPYLVIGGIALYLLSKRRR